MPELTYQAERLLRFLERHADADHVVRPDSGINFETAAQKWRAEELENPPAGIRLGGKFEANVDDFPEVIDELVRAGLVELMVWKGAGVGMSLPTETSWAGFRLL